MSGTQATSTKQSEWEKRVRRAGELAERFAYATEILTFYRHILEFQKTLYDQISAPPFSAPQHEASFREQFDVGLVSRHLPALLSLTRKRGTVKLAGEATEIASAGPDRQRQMLSDALRADGTMADSFFARVLFQPYAEYLAGFEAPRPEGSAGSVCPVCGARPQAAVLRQEGDGGKRFLLCSFCLTEWEFRRILCPVCGEENYQKLPRYTVEELASVRVEACDTCHFYLKSVDMTVDGHAVPLVDEVATVPLDLWATEHGYKKTEANLMGF